MSDSEVLEVTFHFNGEFIVDGSKVKYCNRNLGLSHVDKDKLSIPELEGHLLDHTAFRRCIRMYWLPSGAEVSSGMRLLVDDKSCLDMVNELGATRAVDIYTEPVELDANEETETCSCRFWQVSGIPCQHACAALFKMAEEPNNYVHLCFWIEQYKRTYQHVLQPVEHESAWPVSPNPKPLPPRVKKMPGRPPKNRKKDPSESVKSGTKSSKVGTKIRCGRCKNTGHNSRTCYVKMENTGSHNPSQQAATEPAQSKQSKRKRPATSTQSKRSDGYGLQYNETTESSFIQSGQSKRMASFSRSKSTAEASVKASAGGSASAVIETNAGKGAAKATISVTSGRASANIQSSSLGRGSAAGQSSFSQKKIGKQLGASKKSVL